MKEASGLGISKINVDTDLRIAMAGEKENLFLKKIIFQENI